MKKKILKKGTITLYIWLLLLLTALVVFVAILSVQSQHSSEVTTLYPTIVTPPSPTPYPSPYNMITVTPVPLSLLPASDYPPLYPNITWEQSELEKTNIDRSGVSPIYVEDKLIQSTLLTNITDSQMNDFFNYYTSSLKSKGWTRDNALDSSGMGELLYWTKNKHYFGVGHVDYRSYGKQNAGERFIIEYN